MNIYCATWVDSESFGLSAVVIAESEEEAEKLLEFNPEYQTEIRVWQIGVCTTGATLAVCMCKESL